MGKNSIVIPEGGVFVIPVSRMLGVCAQVWMLDRRRTLANCGVTTITTPKGKLPASVNWSDSTLYRGEVNVIMDEEWTGFGWPTINGFKPARTPGRDEETWLYRILYDAVGFRPKITSFVLPKDAGIYAAELVARNRT